MVLLKDEAESLVENVNTKEEGELSYFNKYAPTPDVLFFFAQITCSDAGAASVNLTKVDNLNKFFTDPSRVNPESLFTNK